MALPSTPQGFYLTQGNGQILAQWQLVAGATSYKVQRSTDNVTFTTLAAPTATSYLDTTALLSVQYWYKVAATNGSGDSPYTSSASAIATTTGNMTLSQVSLAAQQRADRVNSNFVTPAELTSYVNQSYFELYDLLTTLYTDYYVAPPAIFLTNGASMQYPLPDGVLTFLSDPNKTPFVARPFYKLLGVDLGLNTANNAYVTVTRFNFVDRNRFVYPNTASTIYGVFNLQYRLLDNKIDFIPTPTSSQPVRLWYIPRMATLLQPTDVLDGVSGWTEYVITDVAIKILQKEESDVTVLALQKAALIKRINDSAKNRDAGMPDTISDTRGASSWGGYGQNGGPGGSVGGW